MRGFGVAGGVDSGVAFGPAVPGLAPGAFMGKGQRLPVLSRRASKRAQVRMPPLFGAACAT